VHHSKIKRPNGRDGSRDRKQIGAGIAAGIEQAIEDDPIVGYYLKRR
jgi:hypothetical protein